MVQTTRGIVLKLVKYGETSLIATFFTEEFGKSAFLMQGIRSSKKQQSRAFILQPATLLDIVVSHQEQKNLQRVREFQAAYLYTSLQESIIKNTIALFSVELLLRLLPDNAPATTLFEFAFQYFIMLDKTPQHLIANFPLYFIINCSAILGYELNGRYTETTPYLNITEGGFSGQMPESISSLNKHESQVLSKLLDASRYEDIQAVEIYSASRLKLLEWYVTFLRHHAQHLGNIKSLSVIHSILH